MSYQDFSEAKCNSHLLANSIIMKMKEYALGQSNSALIFFYAVKHTKKAMKVETPAAYKNLSLITITFNSIQNLRKPSALFSLL